MLTLILAESALELCPREVWGHPSVRRSAEARGKEPGEILLDRSLHHRAMLSLPDQERRGRPDLVHFSMLEATSTPLYLANKLKLYVHLYGGRVIEVGEGVRLPRSQFRFQGLMEKLLCEGAVEAEGRTLLRVWRMGFRELLEEIKPDLVLGYTRIGLLTSVGDSVRYLLEAKRPVAVVGGFPRGHFSEEVDEALDLRVAIHTLPPRGSRSHSESPIRV